MKFRTKIQIGGFYIKNKHKRKKSIKKIKKSKTTKKKRLNKIYSNKRYKKRK
tara:strand:- start:226 stop:381 length:156 start_codon:yes stop_codon:yes gene_type:complete